jgi:nicotinate-nucleotide adenylyltransferase
LNNPIMAILGGTFDPIHFGHLALATAILKETPAQSVHFMPCHTPVHHKQPIASAHHRVNMLQIAIAKYPHFHYQPFEIERQSPCYTIETLKALKAHYPHTSLCFTVGGDAFASIATWKEYESILKYAHLLVALRNGQSLPTSGKSAEFYKKHYTNDKNNLINSCSGSIMPLLMPEMDVSSTQIREQIKEQMHSESLPSAVLDYIRQHNLYQEPDYAK